MRGQNEHVKALQIKMDAADRELYDEEYEKRLSNLPTSEELFEGIYNQEREYETDDEEGYAYDTYPAPPFDHDWPGVGTIRVIDTYDDHDDGHALYVVFVYEGRTFRMRGWNDSWSGEGGFEGPLEEVEGKVVSKTEWSVVK